MGSFGNENDQQNKSRKLKIPEIHAKTHTQKKLYKNEPKPGHLLKPEDTLRLEKIAPPKVSSATLWKHEKIVKRIKNKSRWTFVTILVSQYLALQVVGLKQKSQNTFSAITLRIFFGFPWEFAKWQQKIGQESFTTNDSAWTTQNHWYW